MIPITIQLCCCASTCTQTNAKLAKFPLFFIQMRVSVFYEQIKMMMMMMKIIAFARNIFIPEHQSFFFTVPLQPSRLLAS